MFRLTSEPIDSAGLRAALENPACGACVAFEGLVRNHNEGRTVLRLEYEAYGALAVKEGEAIVREARAKFRIEEAACVHRTGLLEIGDMAVWVGVASAHRGEAFKACAWIIDTVKQRVPIWKREHYADGTDQWVNCAACAPGHEHVAGPIPNDPGSMDADLGA
ncbi:MAG: molybdopterin-converting factor chain 2 [Fibrobacteria bacterium]|jgi:molybdopterin synthase catalytic subunit|nr:molybdopterin-converting factor chain 2 [Fibrobacteria bacterium]